MKLNMNKIVNNVIITDEINDILNGYIMSDGHVNERGCLTVHHSSKQANFVEWLYEKLEPLRSKAPISDIQNTDKRTNIKYYSKRFFTRSILKKYREMWYKPYTNRKGVLTYKKVLPDNIETLFNSTFVTVWFAGDGTKILGSKGAKIKVTAYSAEERLVLKTLFKEKFNIEVKINRAGKSKSGKEQWVIRIGSKEYSKFYALITQIDLIPKVFPHKLHKKC